MDTALWLVGALGVCGWAGLMTALVWTRVDRATLAAANRELALCRQSEERLRHNEAKNRAILEAAVDGIITIDEGGRIESFNRAAERLFGYEAGEVLGRNVNVLMPAPYRGEHDGYLKAYLKTGHAHIIGIGREVSGRRKDDSVFPMELSVGEASLGGRRLFAGIVRDITERKLVEEELRKSREDAERANMAKTKFLAAASHDLRQPVQSLVFFVSALSAQLAGGPVRAVVQDMALAVDALQMLLDALLDVSKLDAGMVPATPIVFPIDAVLATTRANFTPVATAKGIRLTVVSSGLAVRTDPALLRRVVQNLTENAIRYTRSGGVLVGCRRRGQNLRLEVWDSGIGIAPQHIGDIFEEFTQVSNAERDRGQGLGLGLAIVRRLARLLGHQIQVRSWLGRGSLFWIELPIVVAPLPRESSRCRPRLPASGAPRTIVLIEDEPVVLKSLEVLLESWGYLVIAAASASEAVARLKSLPAPNMILADYRLREGATGTDAIRQLCALFRQPIPGIILTGDTAPERIREAEASGLCVLHKPVTPPVLMNALSETMGNV